MVRMARVVSLVHKPPIRWIILVLSALLVLVGLRRLLLSVHFASGGSGYDFRYLWLAGRVWLNGGNPYDADYRDSNPVLTSAGHVPETWLYPPNWWPLSNLLALAPLEKANLLWNIGGLILCFAASFFVVSAFRWAHSDLKNDRTVHNLLLGLGAALPLLHFFGTAELESTTTAIAVGQTSLLIYFGIALLLYGIAKGSRPLCVTGLVITFLKPQIGLVFAALFLVYTPWTRRTLAFALGLSLVMAVPALVVEPLAPLEMTRNIIREGHTVTANLPQAMTGLRNALWHVFELDVGGLVPGLFAALVGIAGALTFKRIYKRDDPQRVLWLCVTVSTAAIAAFGPLHFYDLVIIACLLPAVLIAPPLCTAGALLGAAIIVRADTFGKATGLYDPNVAIFEGSILATVGALLLFVAAAGAASPAWFGRKTERTPC